MHLTVHAASRLMLRCDLRMLQLTLARSLGDSFGFMPYFLMRAASCSSSIRSGGALGAVMDARHEMV